MSSPNSPVPAWLAYASVAIASSCGMIYELSLGTIASYVVGNAVREFSIVLGLYVSAMGVGAWVSSHVEKNLWRGFLLIELAVALVGGLSPPVLFASVSHGLLFLLVLYGSVCLIGALVGAELPLLMRVLEGATPFRDLVGRGFAFDYFGALFASILFPLALMPLLGLVRATALSAICNGFLALIGTSGLPRVRGARVTEIRVACVGSVLVLAILFVGADSLMACLSD